MNGDEPARPRLNLAVVLPLLAALWIATRPYFGIIHDARLYTVQALNAIYPGRFADDLFFKYGSQDSFTFFSPIFKQLILLLGASQANMVMAALGQVLWFASLLWLLPALFPDRKNWIAAALGVILLYGGYGGQHIFVYAEPFVTPRIFAEAGVLAAFAAALRGKIIVPIFLIVAAAIIHPIMAATGAAVFAVAAIFRDKRWLLLVGAGSILIFALALTGFGPFARLLLRFDDAWFSVVRLRCGFGILSSWHYDDWLKLTADSAILAAGWMLATDREKYFIKIIAVACSIGLILSFIAGDLLRNVLVVNLQTWRVWWLLALLANAWLPIIALRVPKGWVSRELLLVSIAINFMSAFFTMPVALFTGLALLACATFALENTTSRQVQKGVRVGALVLAAATVWFAGLVIYFHSGEEKFFPAVLNCGLAIIALAVLLVLFRQPRARLLPAAAVLLPTVALATADHRNDWQKMIDSPTPPTGVERFLAGANSIYWEGPPGMELTWLNLKKPSYYSCLQGTGAMFYRATAMEYQRRTQALRELNTYDFPDDQKSGCRAKVRIDEVGPTHAAQLYAVCRALPDLDAMILTRTVPGTVAPQWQAAESGEFFEHNPIRIKRISRYYRYNCSEWR
jgi:hypothetical protein